jgi:RNA polymerase sigma-70 factor (ECF subfamily)
MSIASSSEKNITALLSAWTAGDREAGEEVLPLVYGELRRIALSRLRGERADHSLDPTALAHEAYLRLCELHQIRWQDRRHFYRTAARMMRRVLVDHARQAAAGKRGSARLRVTLQGDLAEAALPAVAPLDVDLLALDDALHRLALFDPAGAAAVELHCFAGLSVPETAVELGLSTATVVRRLRGAKAWLARELLGDADGR